MIKIDTDFNFSVLLKLFFSISKKIIFFSPKLTNNNLPLKIYCKNIMIAFLNFNFSFFILFFPYFFTFFFIHISFFFSPPHMYPSNYFFFFFLFFLSPFSLPRHSRTFHFYFFSFFLLSLTTSSSRTFPFLLFFLLFFFPFFPFFPTTSRTFPLFFFFFDSSKATRKREDPLSLCHHWVCI